MRIRNGYFDATIELFIHAENPDLFSLKRSWWNQIFFWIIETFTSPATRAYTIYLWILHSAVGNVFYMINPESAFSIWPCSLKSISIRASFERFYYKTKFNASACFIAVMTKIHWRQYIFRWPEIITQLRASPKRKWDFHYYRLFEAWDLQLYHNQL